MYIFRNHFDGKVIQVFLAISLKHCSCRCWGWHTGRVADPWSLLSVRICGVFGNYSTTCLETMCACVASVSPWLVNLLTAG